MPNLTNDEWNTAVLGMFHGTFGKISHMTGLVSKIIARHKKAIRHDIKIHICDTIKNKRDSGWDDKMDKVCWAFLLKELEDDGENIAI